ncbi:aminodeoxychorismate synthase component I [Massilia sp. DWR3-1-1]|uniref:aminodeoxychorismate synthase component I n=1 Tax=Massilia sp. DWR3-1-1 TaxID=2804559 RepID=UPI003CF1FBC5
MQAPDYADVSQAVACFALLDDASPAGTAPAPLARSRLYTGLAATLTCIDGAGWPAVLAQMQDALARGLYAVPVLTYELGSALLGMATPPAAAPLAQVLLFAHCAHLTSAQVADWLASRADAAPAGIAGVAASVDRAAFDGALARVHEFIAAGDTYQVNFTYRLRFDAFGSPLSLYARLRARQPVPYGALVALPDGRTVLSLSPELFVRHLDGELLARPMKGTAPASTDDAINATRAAALAADPKNRAENLMIVDLLRNDLGRIAVTGSVDASALFDVQRYSTVLQMTSTVRARLREDVGLAQIFTALYPCGSITGAPKRRTMEIIGELESTPRGIYTGAIGWFDPPRAGAAVGDFCLSVPIRTLTLQAPADGVRHGEMGVGAGIVFDSEAADEYAECALKARFLTGLAQPFELFETMRASAADGVRHRERHLARLARSARYFGVPFDVAAAEALLQSACAALAPQAFHRLRLGLRADGTLHTQAAPLTPVQEPVGLLLADDASSADELFLRHKTSVRTRYDAAWREAETRGGFDTVFFNERGELTEGGRSNVFVRIDGRWLTPPLSCGVLPGVMRSLLLEAPAWDAREAIITRAMLAAAQEIVVCNALRGPLRARLLQ